jgi:plastocyanin
MFGKTWMVTLGVAAMAAFVGCGSSNGGSTSTSGSGSGSGSTSSSGSSTSGSGGSSGGAAVNGCTEANATDMSGQSAVTINFGGNAGSPTFGYAPPCIKLGNGTGGVQVTFAGDFVSHPLTPGTDCTADSSGSNPITATNSGTSKTFTLAPAGAIPYIVPYFCAFHCRTSGMKGAIFVH